MSVCESKEEEEENDMVEVKEKEDLLLEFSRVCQGNKKVNIQR